MLAISRDHARRYLLSHQGLRERRFQGEAGLMAFTRQAGCVQFDPVNTCGRSPELTYLSRLSGFEPAWLSRALYEKRELVDHFDKNLAIYPSEDWPKLSFTRDRFSAFPREDERLSAVKEHALKVIAQKGPQTAAGLGHMEKVDWYWASATLARAALEQLYYEGRLLIHSKQGVLKTYDLAANCLPPTILDAENPFESPLEEACWYLRRRLRAVGLLSRGRSDAFLGSPLYYADLRGRAFDRLLETGDILPLRVEGVKGELYLDRLDVGTLESAAGAYFGEVRCELIAPLDSLLWDRKLITALFDFQYTWEIYTPAHKRVYGAYVLPILLGDALVGRVEPVCDRKAGVMRVTGLWWEAGFRPTQKDKTALKKALSRLAAYNRCALMNTAL